MLKIHQLFLRTFTLLFLAILLSFSIATYFWSKNIYIGQIEKNLSQNINTLSLILKDLDSINKIVNDLKAKINLRITIIDERGKVLAESDKDKNLLENHLHRIEIQEAKKYGLGSKIRYSKTINKELLYVAKKVVLNDKIYYIRMADYIDNISSNFIKLSLQIFIFFCIFVILAFLFTYFISTKIKKETNLILKFLEELSNAKPSFSIHSKFSQEFYNITKLLNEVSKKLEKRNKQKIKQRAKLKLANRQKDEIISALSHEFKNPLAVILGYSQTILDEQDLDPKLRNKFLNKIKNHSEKLSFLIDKLRLTSKLESEKQKPILKETSLKKLVLNIISSLEDNYKNRKIIVKGEDTILNIDEVLMSLAISNLIENALKYSQKEVLIQIEKNSLSVIDKGIGINENALEKIQKKFYRVSENKWNNSLGLGLFIVSSILKLHNFSLDVKSEKSKGSQFIIKY